MKLTIFTIGKTKLDYAKTGMEYYQYIASRGKVKVEIVALPDKDPGAKTSPFVILEKYNLSPVTTFILAEWGREYTTPEFIKLLNNYYQNSEDVSFLIGNAWGWQRNPGSEIFKFLSLSTMLFNHELAQLILAEQIYRFSDSLLGGKYGK